MKFLLSIILMYMVQGCGSNQSNEAVIPVVNVPATTETHLSSNVTQEPKKVTVLEVIQVVNYSYMRVKDGEKELWIASPTIETKAGEIVYYQNGMLMKDFESKELKRTFNEIVFVDQVSKDKSGPAPVKETAVAVPNTEAQIPANNMPANHEPAPKTGSSKETIKLNIKIEPAANGVRIADILKSPKSYEGKKVIVKGKITKYTAEVMGKNWVRIQDGSDYKGKFELVLTTSHDLKNVENATFEGIVTLNKDLGYGYFYEILVEDAKFIK